MKLSFKQKTLLSVLIVFTSIIVLIPEMIRYSSIQWLKKNNITAEIDNIDFNPFTARFSIDIFSSTDQHNAEISAEHIAIDLQWLPLLQNKIVIENISMTGIFFTLKQQQQKWKVAGLPNIEKNESSAKTSSPFQYSLQQLTLTNSQISINQEQKPINIHKLTVENLQNIDPTQKANITLDAQLYSAPILIQSNATLAETFHFNGQLNITDLPINKTVTTFLNNANFTATGELSLKETFAIRFNPTNQQISFELYGEIEGTKNTVALLDNDLSLSSQSFSWQGKITNDLQGTTIDSPLLAIENLNINDTKNLKHYVQLEKLLLKNSALSSNQDLSVETLTLQKLTLIPTNSNEIPSLAHANEIVFNAIQAQQLANFHIDTINTRQINAWLERNENKQVKFGDDILALKEKILAIVYQYGDTYSLRLNNLTVTGENKIHAQDDAVKNQYKTQLTISKATLDNVDTRQQDLKSPFTLAAKVDTFSTVELSGDIKFFAPKIELNLNTNINALELPPFSTYLEQQFGYQVESGQLNVNSEFSIHNNIIESKNQLSLLNVEVATIDEKANKELDSHLSMPLASALSILKDSDNNIDLDIPVAGDLTDPNFSSQQIVSKFIGKALTKGTVSFLKLALQPYGAILILAEQAKSAIDHITLESIIYPEGAAEIPDAYYDYIDKLSLILKDKQHLTLTLCGIALENEYKPNTEQEIEPFLLQLAQSRALKIKEILLEKHAIESERLFICKSKIEQTKDKLPRVELSI